MKNMFRRLRWILLVGLFFTTAAFAIPLTEDQKIEAMIHSIEVLPGAVFIRNGSEYGGAAAASHLRMKRRNAGSRIKTASEFIQYCATESSMSGKPYQIRFANGSTMDSAVFFHAELKRIETVVPEVPSPPAQAPAPAGSPAT